MKRFLILATLVVVIQLLAASSTPAVQTTQKKISTTLQARRVNAQTIKALARGKKFVVDLTQRGAVYEFDPGAGRIDFNRVMVRTAQGELTISAFLKRKIPTDKLQTFNYTSQSFKIGTRRAGTLPTVAMKTSNFECNPTSCMCRGLDDCEDLLIGTSLCTDWICLKDEHGVYQCLCFRDPPQTKIFIEPPGPGHTKPLQVRVPA